LKPIGRDDRAFAETRDMGIRGLLYCADYRCSHSIASAATTGPMMSGCPTLRRGLCVGPAPTCGRISINFLALAQPNK